MVNITEIVKSLSPNERKILPYLELSLKEIENKSKLDNISVLRALEFLSNKKIIRLKEDKEKIIEADINGVLYLKKGLPERRLLNLIAEKKMLSMEDAEKQSGLNEGALVGFLADTQIYVNQIEGAKEQLSRKPFTLPTIETENFASVFEWTHDKTKLKNYQHHPKIEFPLAI